MKNIKPNSHQTNLIQEVLSYNDSQPNSNFFNSINYSYLFLGFFTLFLGYFFYLGFRQFDPLSLSFISTQLLVNQQTILPPMLLQSTPSLIHVISLSLINMSFFELSKARIYKIVSFWVFGNILYEIMQSPMLFGTQLIPGTSDPIDMLFALVGGLTIVLSIQFGSNSWKTFTAPLRQANKRQKNIISSFVLLLGLWAMLGCDDGNDAKPIYMSYKDLRAPLQIQDLQQPKVRYGEILISDSILVSNERNVGLHVFDNSDPTNPTFQKFIKIPGNTDMEIKNGILYADSYVDLLIIDISDLNNIYLVERHEYFFEYNPHQSIPSHIVLLDLDESEGVVVEYQFVSGRNS